MQSCHPDTTVLGLLLPRPAAGLGNMTQLNLLKKTSPAHNMI